MVNRISRVVLVGCNLRTAAGHVIPAAKWFERLRDTKLADGKVQGGAPSYTITSTKRLSPQLSAEPPVGNVP